jgi:hypothetical protein
MRDENMTVRGAQRERIKRVRSSILSLSAGKSTTRGPSAFSGGVL